MRAVDFMGLGGARTPRHSSSHCWERGCQRTGPSPENFPTNKIFLPHIPGLGAEEGTRILWVGRNHALTSFSAKKWAVKDGDFCARHFLRGRFSEPPKGGTTHAKNRGFFTSRATVAVVAGAGKARSRASVTVLPPSFPLALAHSSGLRLGVVCRAERKIKRKRKGNGSLGARPTVTSP